MLLLLLLLMSTAFGGRGKWLSVGWRGGSRRCCWKESREGKGVRAVCFFLGGGLGVCVCVCFRGKAAGVAGHTYSESGSRMAKISLGMGGSGGDVIVM